MRQALGGQLLHGEPDALPAVAVDEQHVGAVVERLPLRADPVGLPDRLQLRAVAEQEPHPAVAQAALEEELARALGRVVDRVDRDSNIRKGVATEAGR